MINIKWVDGGLMELERVNAQPTVEVSVDALQEMVAAYNAIVRERDDLRSRLHAFQ